MHIKLLGAVLLLNVSLSGQINQSHPELCGSGSASAIAPEGLSAVQGIGPQAGDTVLVWRQGSLETRLVLEAWLTPIDQICVLPGGELIAFEPFAGNFTIARIKYPGLQLIDEFQGRDPAVSPNAHWLIMLPFHHPTAPDAPSEEYLLYDLTKDSKQNRMPGLTPYTSDLVGRPVYPIPHDGTPFEHVGLPPEQSHTFRSESFFWAPDSSAVAFADSVQDKISLVVVTPGTDGPSTRVLPVDRSQICEEDPGDIPGDIPFLTMNGADFGGSQVLTANFSASGRCTPHALTVHLSDFRSPIPEVHVPPKRQPAVVNGVIK